MSNPVLVCVAVAEAPRYITPGSTILQCADCGQDIYVADTSLAVMEKYKAEPCCTKCAMVRAATDDEGPRVLMSPGQREELKKTFGLTDKQIDQGLERAKVLANTLHAALKEQPKQDG